MAIFDSALDQCTRSGHVEQVTHLPRCRRCPLGTSFEPLFSGHRGHVFPCDVQGKVDLDGLGERALQNYLYVRAMMGRETAWPRVEPSLLH